MLKTARYILRIIYPRFIFGDFLRYLLIQYCVDTAFSKKYKEQYFRGFKFKVIPDELHREIVLSSCGKYDFYDSQHQILVPRYLFKKLYDGNLFYRDEKSLWISLMVPSTRRMFLDKFERQNFRNLENCLAISFNMTGKNQNKNGNKIKCALNMKDISQERIVQIIPHLEKSEFVYLTETHLFNIHSNLGTKYFGEDFRMKFAPIESQSLAPKIASLMVVKMVNSSQRLGTDLIDMMLSNYFKTPKFLHQYDYFGIPATEEFTENLHMKYFGILKTFHKIYFKCVLLKSKDENLNQSLVNIGYFVIRGETELRQDQNFNSFIPQKRFLTIVKENIKDYETKISQRCIQSCPTALSKYLREMLYSIEPFVRNRKGNR